MAGAAVFRHVTILHTSEDQVWCDYVKRHFKSDQLNMRMETLAVDALTYESPPELEVAIRESHVLVLLTTTYFLHYMEQKKRWLPSMLQKGDREFSTQIFTLLDLTPEDMEETCNEHGYEYDGLRCTEINVDGSNIKQVALYILELVQTLADKRESVLVQQASRRPPRRGSQDGGVPRRIPSGTNKPLRIVPAALPMTGQEVALLFSQEVTDSVTVNFNHIKENIPCDLVNPYCAVFRVPDLPGGKQVNMRVNVDGARHSRHKLDRAPTVEFNSVEMLCQSYGASSREELDKMLATNFSQSLCADPYASKIFENISDKPSSSDTSTGLYPTFLHWAAANGFKELCSALLSAPSAGTACDIYNVDGDDPIDLARKNGQAELADLIDEFIDAQDMADTCDLYVQYCGSSLRGIREEPEEDVEYEAVDSNAFDSAPYLTMGHLKKAAAIAVPGRGSVSVQSQPPETPPRLPGRRTQSASSAGSASTPSSLPPPTVFWMDPDPVPLATGAVGSRSQTELIEIQEEVKKGNFNLVEAEMLFKSWKHRYGAGCAVSFKDRQQGLRNFQKEHQKTFEVLRHVHAGNKKTKETKKQTSEAAEVAVNISEPILKRQHFTPSKRASEKKVDSDTSTHSNVSCHSLDSGRCSTVSNTSIVSHASSSSDEIEYSQPNDHHPLSDVALRTQSESEENFNSLAKMNRVSLTERYEVLLEETEETREPSPPPPPVPARTRPIRSSSSSSSASTAAPTSPTDAAVCSSPVPKTRVYSRRGSSKTPPITAPKPQKH